MSGGSTRRFTKIAKLLTSRSFWSALKRVSKLMRGGVAEATRPSLKRTISSGESGRLGSAQARSIEAWKPAMSCSRLGTFTGSGNSMLPMKILNSSASEIVSPASMSTASCSTASLEKLA